MPMFAMAMGSRRTVPATETLAGLGMNVMTAELVTGALSGFLQSSLKISSSVA
jgi:hypothetical protein